MSLLQLGRPGPVGLSSFGPIIVLAILAGLVFAERRARRRGFAKGTMVSCATFALAGAFVGCRVVPIVVSPGAFVDSPAELLRLFTASAGAWYGGFLGGVAGLVLFCRRRKLEALAVLDVAAPAIALGKVIGPFACLAAGCDHGRPAPGVPWAIVYSDPRSAVSAGFQGIPLHPAPLYDAIANLAILAGLLLFERHSRRPEGERRVFGLYCLAYATARFFIETYRGDASRGLYFGGALSTSQIVSIAIVAAVLAAALFRRDRALRFGRPRRRPALPIDERLRPIFADERRPR